MIIRGQRRSRDSSWFISMVGQTPATCGNVRSWCASCQRVGVYVSSRLFCTSSYGLVGGVIGKTVHYVTDVIEDVRRQLRKDIVPLVLSPHETGGRLRRSVETTAWDA